jgi:predicted metal-dependent phosphotriesterase family hydrolase
MPVMTVRGAVDPDSLGYTLSHEHLLCDLWPLIHSYDGILDDESLAVAELALYRDAGGRTIVDVTNVGLGRNPAALRRISEATGVNIVMGAGWYREPVYPSLVYELDTNALADAIVREITQGVGDTDVRAGVIGEIGTERKFITPAQERVFRAAARAHSRTGAAVLTHTTHFGELALEQIALLREEGVPPDRIIISHLGDRFDQCPLLAIARQGVYLSIDNIGYRGNGYPSDSIRAANIRTLIAEGHVLQILLSGDVCMKSHLHAYEGKGYDHVPRCFLPLLREHDISAAHIHQMTVANPASALEMPVTQRELCRKAAEAE